MQTASAAAASSSPSDSSLPTQRQSRRHDSVVAKQLRLLLRAAEEGPTRFDPYLVLQLEASPDLQEEAVLRSYEEKRLLASRVEGEEKAKVCSVVERARQLLADPLLRQSCLVCLTSGRGGNRNEDPHEVSLGAFEKLLSRFEGGDSKPTTPKTPESLSSSFERKRKKAERRSNLRAYQEQQRQEREDAVLFAEDEELLLLSRDRKRVEKERQRLQLQRASPAASASSESSPTAQFPSTPPTPAPPVLDPSLPGHRLLQLEVKPGSATAVATLRTAALSVMAAPAVELAVLRGAEAAQPPDTAAVSALEDAGYCTARSAAGVLRFSAPDGARNLRTHRRPSRQSNAQIDVDSGPLAAAVLWLLPAFALFGQHHGGRGGRASLKGHTDAGALPVEAVGFGYCHLLALFGRQGCAVTVDKRRGNYHSTATVTVAPVGGTDDSQDAPCAAGGKWFAVPFQLTEQGTVQEVTISAWVSRSVPLGVGQKTAQAALTHLEKSIPGVTGLAQMQLWKEDNVVTDTVYVFVSMKSSTRGVWCGWSVGGRGTKAEHTGERAAQAVCSDFSKGGCVSDYLQEHLPLLMASCAPSSTPSRVRVNLPLTPQLQATMMVLQTTCPNVTFAVTPPPLREGCTAILECTVGELQPERGQGQGLQL